MSVPFRPGVGGVRSRPSSCAGGVWLAWPVRQLASCTRDCTPSLANTARRWVLTVLMDTPRADAADLFVFPSLIRVATRRSASVREAHPVAGAAAVDHLVRRAPAW